MEQRRLHILLIEPYFGGSHRLFLEGLVAALPDFDFTFCTLPARNWKGRMQMAAPWAARQIGTLLAEGLVVDGVLASTFVDLAVLRGLLARSGVTLPMAVYFHENQFAYPQRDEQVSNRQFAAINFNSALVADQVAFNSQYNAVTFIEGVRQYVEKIKEPDSGWLIDALMAKSAILYPGLDYTAIDAVPCPRDKQGAPVLLWNHRWEHDKDPNAFVSMLYRLHHEQVDFQLIVLGAGEATQREQLLATLGPRVLHWGYVPDRQEYLRWLKRGDLVVSTARHEFYGMAVMEAVRAGCRPLVPDRLSYQELFPDHLRYADGLGVEQLARQLKALIPLDKEERCGLTAAGSWARLSPRYAAWLQGLCGQGQPLTE
jgi:glycosyltransferase involved in cell wall biosynthesis